MSTRNEESHSGVPARTERADARRNRTLVLQAAHTAFAARGLDVQIEDIARQAGVGVGTVYRRFPTKEALVAAVLVDRLQYLSAAALEALHEPGSGPWSTLERAVWRMAEVAVEDRAFTQAVQSHPEILVAAGLEEAMREFIGLLAQIVGRAQEAGVLRRDVLAGDLPELVIGIASAVGPFAAPGTSPVWQRYVRILLDGLRAPARGGRDAE